MPFELSEKMLAECRRQHVPCELVAIKGAGHGFAGKDRKQAELARDAWFEEIPATAVGPSYPEGLLCRHDVRRRCTRIGIKAGSGNYPLRTTRKNIRPMAPPPA